MAVFACLVAGGAVSAVSTLMQGDLPSVAAAATPPSLPVSVGGVGFSVPTDAIRTAAQRRSGQHERIDLAFSFPDLAPAHHIVSDGLVPRERDVFFVTMARSDGAMPARERQRDLYPHFLTGESREADGLTITAFRANSPYQGEDLVRDRTRADGFMARCTRTEGAMPGFCSFDRRIGGVDVAIRFPREWLPRWREVERGSAEAVARMRRS